MRVERALSACLAAVALAGVVLAVVAVPASAQAAFGERIESWSVDTVIEPDGTVVVSETVRYDFATASDRHGFVRSVLTRQHYDDRYDRVYGLELVDATADGAAVRSRVERSGDYHLIRLGDPDVVVSGVVTYRYTYELTGILNGFLESDELYWNVIDQTDQFVDVESAAVTVRAPGALIEALCFAGPVGSSSSCDAAAVIDGTARYEQSSVPAGEVLTVVAVIPSGAVTVALPVLDERWSLRRAFTVDTSRVAGAVGILIAGLAAIFALALARGRDRQAVGSPVDAIFPAPGAASEPVPTFRRPIAPIEFEPPDGVRPGMIGLLTDERVDAVDLSATLVDLAVRGYLRIDELDKRFLRRQDYRLVQLIEPDAALAEYERRLLAKIFATSTDVQLSSLRHRVDLDSVRQAMYAEAMRHKWFHRRPDRTRGRWESIGGGVVVVGLSLTVLLAWRTHWALLGVPVAIVGWFLQRVAPRFMPQRTVRGTAALRRALGFREFIVNSEVHRARFAERRHIFTEYLPYAVAFEATDRWARTFADLGGDPEAATTDFYHGPRRFAAGELGESLGEFSASLSSVLGRTAGGSGGRGSSGGGRAGGGGGGGGGGSW